MLLTKSNIMKKIMMILIMGIFLVSTGFSQEETPAPDLLKNKKGQILVPETGDWAIGFNAVPMLNMALNAINIMDDSGQDATGMVDYQTGFNQTLVAKVFMSQTMAFRVRFHINNTTTSTTSFGDDPLDTSSAPQNIQLQKQTIGRSDYLVGIGMEMRKGKSRIQGFYGGEALLGLNGTKTKTTYDIAYNTALVDAGQLNIGDSRVLSDKTGMGLVFGARGFIGVEYFICPKISIGAEYGLGLYIATTPRGKQEIEEWEDPDNDGAGSVNVEEVEGASKSMSMGIEVDNGNDNALGGGTGSLTATFHF